MVEPRALKNVRVSDQVVPRVVPMLMIRAGTCVQSEIDRIMKIRKHALSEDGEEHRETKTGQEENEAREGTGTTRQARHP